MEFRHCGIRWFRFRREALEALPSALGMIFIAVAMNLAFLVYGLLKEELVTRDHFSSIYIVIASRMSVIPALLGVLFVQSAGVEGEGAHAPQNDVSWVVRLLGAPLTMFAFFSFANDTSTWAGCEMLKYVSLAVQVMAKSASVLPNRSTTLGSTCKPSFWSPMQLEDEKMGKCGSSATSQTNDASSWPGPFGSFDLQMGGLLLVVFLHLTASLRSIRPKSTSATITYRTATLTVAVANHVYAVFVGLPVSEKSMGDVSQAALVKLGLLALTNVLGQVLNHCTIKQYGALIFQWVMTTRKVLSVVCSFTWFGHSVTPRKAMCIIFVFGLLMYQKVASKTSKGKNLKENGGDAKKAEHGKWRVSSWSVDITSETSQSDTESKPQRSSLRSWWVGGKLKES